MSAANGLKSMGYSTEVPELYYKEKHWNKWE